MEKQINRANRTNVERPAEKEGLVAHLRTMLRVFSSSRRRGALLWLGAGLALVMGATVYGQIRLNACSRPFYERSRARTFRVSPRSFSCSSSSPGRCWFSTSPKPGSIK